MVLMQGDFTDRPEDLPELLRRFEGGADFVLGRRPSAPEQPQAERRLRGSRPGCCGRSWPSPRWTTW
jgi:hypothetical protein